MRAHFKRFSLASGFASLCAAAYLLGVGCQTPTPTPPQGIPAFRWIDKDWGICAGGQPDSQGWIWLSAQPAGQRGQGVGRVDHIIKLNEDSEASDNMAVISYGYSLDYDPISVMWQTNPLCHEDLDRYIRETLHLVRPGTIIHCQHGQDRTGAFVYAYRRNCGWSDKDARLELMTNGFHEELLGLKYFVDHYQPDLQSTNTPKAWKATLTK